MIIGEKVTYNANDETPSCYCCDNRNDEYFCKYYCGEDNGYGGYRRTAEVVSVRGQIVGTWNHLREYPELANIWEREVE